MRFLFDENVPRSAAAVLERHGHVVDFIATFAPLGSPDPIVARVSEEIEAVLVSFDGDFQKIAPRIPMGHRIRFRRLSRIHLRCGEPQAASRLEAALSLIEAEHALAQGRADRRITITIGKSFIRTDR